MSATTTVKRNPSAKDEKNYKLFVAFAVLGKQADADEMLKRRLTRDSIFRFAKYLHAQAPIKLETLYRGLLLDPQPAMSGKISSHYTTAQYVSFSESKDVACWFARTDSHISEPYAQQFPQATGWIATYLPKSTDEVIFHYSWKNILESGRPSIYEVTQEITAAMVQMRLAEPNDASRFIMEIRWHLQKQQEVIVKPGPELTLISVDAAGCPNASLLDSQFVPRPDWVVAPPGLETMGFPAGAKMAIRDIELYKPMQKCPVCNQRAVEHAYIFDKGLIVLSCIACRQRTFALRRTP